ncbi:hypothetical protein LCGC14_1191170 [marine sediment metagenome]|uniref:DNA-directed DNA polymerase family A palm domain-containing protein n=1 Tax=marine sediment metagenome TaxID=412755 RepID=A0A0F9LP40_9ZZZZ
MNKEHLANTIEELIKKYGRKRKIEELENVIKRAKELEREFIKNGKIKDELIKHCIYLAQIDLIYRAGKIDKNMGIANEKDIEDLKNLISLVDDSVFKSKKNCLLNPGFNDLSLSADADRVIDQYHNKIRGVRELADKAKQISNRRGYLRTRYGRHIRFPRGYKSYKSSGILIQATSADINKENWCLIDEALDGRGRMILNTHDSYSLSCDIDKWGEANRDVRRAVERDFLGVPLLLDFNGMGPNWWAALQDKGIDNVITVKRNKRNRAN